MKVLIMVFGVLFTSLWGIELSGIQYGDFPKVEDYYIITDSLLIPEGKTMTLEAGTIIQCNEFSTILVEGSLVIEGTVENKVFIETSDNTTSWNGIITRKSGTVKIAHTQISSAFTGIQMSSANSNLGLEKVLFYGNEINLQIGDEIIDAESESEITLYPEAPEVPEKALNSLYQEERNVVSPGMIILRSSLMAASLASIGTWAYFNQSAEHYKTKYEYATDPSMANSYKETYNTHKRLSNVGMIGTIVTVPIFTYTITIKDFSNFKRRRKNEKD